MSLITVEQSVDQNCEGFGTQRMRSKTECSNIHCGGRKVQTLYVQI